MTLDLFNSTQIIFEKTSSFIGVFFFNNYQPVSFSDTLAE